jgi:hypothetical protein
VVASSTANSSACGSSFPECLVYGSADFCVRRLLHRVQEVLPYAHAGDGEHAPGCGVDRLDGVIAGHYRDAHRQLADQIPVHDTGREGQLLLRLGLAPKDVLAAGTPLQARPWCKARRERRRQEEAFSVPAIDLIVPVYGREQIGQKGGGFGLAHHQVAAVAQGVGEQLKRPALQFVGEVDQNVTAYHQVYVGERRTLGQVVLPEHDHAPDLLLYLVGAVLLDEVAPYLL